MEIISIDLNELEKILIRDALNTYELAYSRNLGGEQKRILHKLREQLQ